jgi:hypothetical protein
MFRCRWSRCSEWPWCTAVEITAKVRDESLAHIKEVTEMFVSSLAGWLWSPHQTS